MQEKQSVRKQILEQLKGSHNIEGRLRSMQEMADQMYQAAVFGGFTYRHQAERFKQVYDICEALLEELKTGPLED